MKTTHRKKIVILYSGGMDSLVMARFAAFKEPEAEVVKLYIDLGHAYAFKERACLPADTEIRSLDWMQDRRPVGKAMSGSASGDIIIPGRNMVLAAIAASIHLPDEVWMGALCGEDHAGSTDKNAKFRKLMSKSLGYVLSPWRPKGVTIRFPFIEQRWGKLDMTRWAIGEGGIPKEAIRASSSCLSGTAKPCGRCVVCWRRWGIFTHLDIPVDDFEIHPFRAAGFWAMVAEMLHGDHYDRYRCDEVLWALDRLTDQELLDKGCLEHDVRALREYCNPAASIWPWLQNPCIAWPGW